MDGTSPSRASRIAATGNECHDGKCEVSSTHSEGEVMAIVTVGIDLAKNVFALHGVDEAGATRLKQPKVARGKLNAAVAALAPRVIGVEACSGALLGAPVPGPRSHGQADGAQAGDALPHERQARQERCGRRRGDLRSGAASEHALCADQERGAAVAGNTTRLSTPWPATARRRNS